LLVLKMKSGRSASPSPFLLPKGGLDKINVAGGSLSLPEEVSVSPK
jgi:hypothetical protein